MINDKKEFQRKGKIFWFCDFECFYFWYLNERHEYKGSLFGSFYCIPGFLTEGAGVFVLGRPATDAVSVVCVIAGTPTDQTGFAVSHLAGLAFETGLVDTVFAYGTVFDSHVPTPQGHGVPLFDLNTFIDLHRLQS